MTGVGVGDGLGDSSAFEATKGKLIEAVRSSGAGVISGSGLKKMNGVNVGVSVGMRVGVGVGESVGVSMIVGVGEKLELASNVSGVSVGVDETVGVIV